MSKPADWKNYEDFAAGIDTNRLPSTARLAGCTFRLAFDAQVLVLDFTTGAMLDWSQLDAAGALRADSQGRDAYEAVEVAPHTLFIDITFAAKPREALTLIMNTATHRVLSVHCVAGDAAHAVGAPLVDQRFEAGVIEAGGAPPSAAAPAPTRDLIGLRT